MARKKKEQSINTVDENAPVKPKKDTRFQKGVLQGTPFQKGNTAAAGVEYDIDEEIAALDEWSKKEDSVFLMDYVVSRGFYDAKIYEIRDKFPAYAEALIKAKNRILCNQHRKLHDSTRPYNYGVFMRTMGFYDGFLREHEDQEKNKDAARAAKVRESQEDSLAIKSGKALSAQLDALKYGKDLKSEETSKSDDNKS